MDVKINNTKTLIEFFMKNYISEIKVAVDMTVGNGFDSKNILEILQPKKLYCFDIQKEALENSKILLEKYSNCELILENHKNFYKYVKENIDFAIYNLGYLPKGDKYITTNAEDVEESLKKLLEKLNSKGVIFITFYIGHSAGQIESLEISKFLQNLNQKEYTILKFTFENQKNNPPYVVMIQKI
ncbi:class I SAM-dependent methyltransferase [Parvimonas sp. D2]|uniref:tRNA (mnm(5)s(2)U34)-methyltransferase n=1 Tax=unclassified Parvimonas TaxID=1151464 RepID=UPI002B4A27AE|nr:MULTISPECIES: class I SAM-dependent methyltransferase [unclassified Parvimonas]MEB3011774.1 class I SAM-dependent methyltransferase [Parvimonas sp. D2]MEB3087266.1 class I SAM-dependent methyltransferase [Parvimonas sp. D4]